MACRTIKRRKVPKALKEKRERAKKRAKRRIR